LRGGRFDPDASATAVPTRVKANAAKKPRRTKLPIFPFPFDFNVIEGERLTLRSLGSKRDRHKKMTNNLSVSSAAPASDADTLGIG
jgi:hypothetical protein